MFILTGLLCSASGLWRDYEYINRKMTWTEAQSYCRERYTDLATVDSMVDVNTMINLVNETDGYTGSVWLGLTRKNQSNWGWSMGDDTLTQYSAWDSPNASSEGACGYSNNRTWFTTSCSTELYFMCYKAGNIFVNCLYGRNWTDAQAHCREKYVDLLTVHDLGDQERLYTKGVVWIGLFIDSWRWSDQWNLTFRNWAVGYPSVKSESGDCVAMSIAASGKWAHDNCSLQRPFICHGTQMNKQQIIRVNLSCENCNLNDSSLQMTTMSKINKKMQSLGLGTYNDVMWMKDEGGEVFHMEINRTAKTKTACNGN
ncbi:macrophage mannose receptor 1-like [Misgurnus anguillicaudatus]|uniref:macrophage mannose receptor 1-like n=1 Tax=Misgurnus anguillicaudatus TaxID=75329 RepID=UPI003CCF6E1E